MTSVINNKPLLSVIPLSTEIKESQIFQFDPLQLNNLDLKVTGNTNRSYNPFLFSAFSVILNGKTQKLNILKSDLQKITGANSNAISLASATDNLISILGKTIFDNNPNFLVEYSRKHQVHFHFSRKDYNLPNPIYVSQDGYFLGDRSLNNNGLISQDGSESIVKRATSSTGERLARRIVTLDANPELRKTQIENLKRFETYAGRKNIIPLRGRVEYVNSRKQTKCVLFFLYVESELFEKIKGWMSELDRLPEISTRYEWADQIFTGLESLLPATNIDFKPENVLVNQDSAYLIDLSGVLTNEELRQKTNEIPARIMFSNQWMAPELSEVIKLHDEIQELTMKIYVNSKPPEITDQPKNITEQGVTIASLSLSLTIKIGELGRLRERLFTEKIASWGMGCILRYLLTTGAPTALPWQVNGNSLLKFSQESINGEINSASDLNEQIRNLILKMLVLNPNQRLSIQEAAREFREIIFRKELAPLKRIKT